MRIPGQLDEKRFGFNMTPMIDIVFLLIIFFLVTMELDKRRPIDLSDAKHGQNSNEKDESQLEVSVTDDGQMYVGEEAVDETRLRQILETRKAMFADTLEVRIRPSRRAEYGDVKPILLACAELEIWRFKIAHVKPTGGSE